MGLVAVDGSRGGEHQPGYTRHVHRLQQCQRATYIILEKRYWRDNRLARFDQGCKMDHAADVVALHRLYQLCGVGNISLHKSVAKACITVTCGEVVIHHRAVSCLLQGKSCMGTDIAGTTDDKDIFIHRSVQSPSEASIAFWILLSVPREPVRGLIYPDYGQRKLLLSLVWP